MSWHYHLTATKSGDVRTILKQQLLIPKHLIYQLRKAKRVQINQHYLPMNFTVEQGASIDLTFEAQDFHQVQIPTPDDAQSVEPLYETNDLIVVNKRRGDKTHPNQPGELGATINHVAAYLKPQGQVPYIIHRLDQQTSGAIIFGKNPSVVPILTRLISTKQIKRTYLAWVTGIINQDRGTIDQPIGIDPTDQRKRQINGPNAAPAVTHFTVQKRDVNRTLVKIELETGRTHQIRVHFASIGHPLVGDPLYNEGSPAPLQLHSAELTLIRPFYMQTKFITAPLPDDFIM
ncbi:RluA family pseudouridine synthase [Nicoliella sp. Es01]|uniref:RNA pseudouridylate synthase n=1 Tax=Nicoliella lavandulae TaxID=3082954 RepID=A0ABU8SJH0_9LACO